MEQAMKDLVGMKQEMAELLKIELKSDITYDEKLSLMEAIKEVLEKLGEIYSRVKDKSENGEEELVIGRINEFRNRYTYLARVAAFDEILETKHPLLELTKRLMFKTLKFKEKDCVFEETEIQLNAVSLKNYAKAVAPDKEIATNSNWWAVEEKALALMVYNRAKYLGFSVKLEEFVNTFKLSKSAYDYEFTEIEKPELKGALKVLIVHIMKARYGMEMDWGSLITEKDVAYFESCMYTKDNKQRLTVKATKNAKASDIFTDIAHNHIEGVPYTLAYNTRKK